MIQVNFKIMLPNAMGFLVPKKIRPKPAEIWNYGGRLCEVQAIGNDYIFVKTRVKSNVKVVLSNFIELGIRVSG